ncbi:DNA methyltransferase [Stomatobaculum longum]|uniref:DNA methyltransferase n=1 Tax=Stomatobaculum longum TaxID=796942 RepID=UPI0028E837EF|nr:DNA methyltransferase [Stomatobaculum longum]
MKSTEFILVYSKSKEWDCAPIVASEKVTNRYNKIGENGIPFRETDLRKTGNADRRQDRPLMWYPFYYNEETEDLQVRQDVDKRLVEHGYVEIFPIKPDNSEGRWRWGYQTAVENIGNLVARIMPKYKSQKKYTVYEIEYIDKKGDIRTVKEHTSWDRKEFNSDNAMNEFKNLGFSNQLFPFPKSSALIKHMVYLANLAEGDIVLDFFSGSGTTAQSVMQLNAEDGEKRRFIMVQLPEETGESSEAFTLGYSTICDIGKERIRRAGQQITEKSPLMTQNLDIGFRVLKLDTTNMNDVYYSAGEYTQNMLSMLESNVKADRTDLDLLFGCLLEWGLPLSMPYTSEQIEGCTVHTYNDGDLIACFDENIPDSVIKEIAKCQPLRAVFRDSSFNGSPAKINVGEIFKMRAPDTRVKVI